jgi:hypothetical protein
MDCKIQVGVSFFLTANVDFNGATSFTVTNVSDVEIKDMMLVFNSEMVLPKAQIRETILRGITNKLKSMEE